MFSVSGEQFYETGVILGGVDPDRGLFDYADQDRFSLVEDAELLEPFGFFAEGLRRPGKGKEEVAPIGVKTDVLVVEGGCLGQERLASMARIRDHTRAPGPFCRRRP